MQIHAKTIDTIEEICKPKCLGRLDFRHFSELYSCTYMANIHKPYT